MDISRQAATAKGPAETFTGEAWIDPITRGLRPPSGIRGVAGAQRLDCEAGVGLLMSAPSAGRSDSMPKRGARPQLWVWT